MPLTLTPNLTPFPYTLTPYTANPYHYTQPFSDSLIHPDPYTLHHTLRILPVLNSPTDNKGESRENKTRANILIYTVEAYTVELEDDEYMK